MKKQKQSGFTLLELLVVVAVVLIISAIAVPALLKAQVAARHSAAAQALRNISSAEGVYHSNVEPAKYDTLAALGTAGQLDAQWVTNAISATGQGGYTFSELGAPGPDTFAFAALPSSYPGARNAYCITERGTLHVADGTAGMPAIADAAACMALPVLNK